MKSVSDELDLQDMQLLQQGDTSAYQRLVERHSQWVLNLLFRYTQDSFEAEDLAQDVFFKLYQASQQYQPQAKFKTWLYRIVVNTALNRLRSAKKLERKTLSLERKKISLANRPRENVLAKMEFYELQEKVLELLERLSPQQRLVLLLKRYENLSCAEIAEITQMSTTAIKSLLHRARKRIRDGLVKEGFLYEEKEQPPPPKFCQDEGG
ncbi:MAG: RNA polymerase sigma factor [Planctomycetota bacterium]|nr:MAG: RNA polymerase sigma factor [Planctomycetota bacterium]